MESSIIIMLMRRGIRQLVSFDQCLFLIVVQLLYHIWLFVTPCMAVCQASLSFTISHSFLKLMSIESVMLSNHLILCHPLLFPAIFLSIRSFPMSQLFCIPNHFIQVMIQVLFSSWFIPQFAFIIPVPWHWCHISLWHLWLPFGDLIKDFPWIHPNSCVLPVSYVHFHCVGHSALSWSNRQRINENRWGQAIFSFEAMEAFSELS